MKIAIIADPYIPVPPLTYGGIERIIDFLITGLTANGHEVLLLAHPQSEVRVTLIKYGDQQSKLKHVLNILAVNKIRKFKPDVIHSFGRLFYLLPFLRSDTPKIMSYQREPTLAQIKKAVALSKKDTLSFTGCSNYIADKISTIALTHIIFNGVDLKRYEFKAEVALDAPLIFLGRIEPIKGTHIAIEVAKKTNKKLIIAGNIPSEHQAYFNTKIQPELNNQITYVGAVDDSQKNELLGNAAALLMPIEWDEPFGIVMTEAMACGTPVIGFNRGSVPEVIINDLNGYRCNTISEMINLITKIPQLDRQKIREDCEKRFSAETITIQYLNLYQKMITLSRK